MIVNKWFFLIPGALLGLLFMFYEFKHPEKTKTQCTIDLFNGEVFNYYLKK